MSAMQQEPPTVEHDELIDMRTHLTVAVLAATQLRRTGRDDPDAARFDAYLDQALNNLVDDMRKVDALVAQTEACARAPASPRSSPRSPQRPKQHLIPRLARAPFHLARRVAHAGCQWAGRHGFVRLVSLAAYD
jgi:hypothetical protein